MSRIWSQDLNNSTTKTTTTNKQKKASCAATAIPTSTSEKDVHFMCTKGLINSSRIKIPFNLASAPYYAIIILLASGSIDFRIIINGFVGSEGIEPYSIMILFYALAYICVSLDLTGFVEFCAAFTSNDVVVLTGTIFLVYYTKQANINPPIAFFISEFMAANIASMTLYIGNPTNVIVSQAYSISFVKYSAWMLAPTIVSIILAYIFLRIVFRNPKFIPNYVDPPKRNPREVLKDKFGAILGVILLGLCLIALMATSFTKIKVWVVTLPFAVASMIKDIIYDLIDRRKIRNDAQENQEKRKSNTEFNTTIDFSSDRTIVNVDKKDLESDIIAENFENLELELQNEIGESKWHCYSFKNIFPTMYSVFIRMPGSLLPFSIGMFILVEALSSLGWIALFARIFSTLTPSYIPAVFVTATISIVLCNLLNNLPMTVLLTRVIQHPNFSQAEHVTESVKIGCLFALVIGSNVGACFTVVGALAGLMWDKILRDKKMQIGYWQFLKWNLGVMPIVSLGAYFKRRVNRQRKRNSRAKSLEKRKLPNSGVKRIKYLEKREPPNFGIKGIKKREPPNFGIKGIKYLEKPNSGIKEINYLEKRDHPNSGKYLEKREPSNSGIKGIKYLKKREPSNSGIKGIKKREPPNSGIKRIKYLEKKEPTSIPAQI
ncbi:11223_t:CDS:2 [Diversispora eburnea]|uniref:11223_t:CDS:1 n=1 Tax=Diversispora eburnea TaxID=1213867 RepID=A0A9N9F2J1_9GLOM|nr:11223_t:CDS:2 [Diversispora eburnea]